MPNAPVSSWSSTPASNANLAGMPMFEGMSPAQLNDSIRAMMGVLFDAYIALDASNLSAGNLTAWRTAIAAAKTDASNISSAAAWITALAAAKNDGSNISSAAAWITALGAAKNDGSNISSAAAWLTALGLPTTITQSIHQTGDIKTSMATVAPTGWLGLTGTTIGDASSGGTGRANADTVNLYTLLWNGYSQTVLPIQTSAGGASARGGSAAADYAAHKRLPLFDFRGRFLRQQDTGAGLDAGRVLGSTQANLFAAHSHFNGMSGQTGADFPFIYGSTGTDVPGVAAKRAAPSGNPIDIQGITQTVGGAETRPENIAVNHFIAL